MQTMIERVARASFACWRKRMDELGLHQDKNRNFEDMNTSEHEFALMNAKAMIEAMREPTDEMIAHSNKECDAVDNSIGEDMVILAYKTMIDAALKE